MTKGPFCIRKRQVHHSGKDLAFSTTGCAGWNDWAVLSDEEMSNQVGVVRTNQIAN